MVKHTPAISVLYSVRVTLTNHYWEPSDERRRLHTERKGKTHRAVSGKEAAIGILSEGDFFGEGCLTGEAFRMSSAATMIDSTVMRIDKKSMTDAIHREHAFSDIFVAYLQLARNIRYEEDLVDQLFNSSEKRLARVLLLLAHFGKDGKPEVAIPKISQESMAEMVGTTLGGVNFFMNRFRKLGVVDLSNRRSGTGPQFTFLSVVLYN
jgi:CRP/FNR family transcriptional regulator, cyclic AMP receptor protein